jgi:hypothetical protein
VKTEDYNPEEEEGAGLFVLLRFTFVPSYPAEAPLVEVEESENILPEHLGRTECLYILFFSTSKILLKEVEQEILYLILSVQ